VGQSGACSDFAGLFCISLHPLRVDENLSICAHRRMGYAGKDPTARRPLQTLLCLHPPVLPSRLCQEQKHSIKRLQLIRLIFDTLNCSCPCDVTTI